MVEGGAGVQCAWCEAQLVPIDGDATQRSSTLWFCSADHAAHYSRNHDACLPCGVLIIACAAIVGIALAIASAF